MRLFICTDKMITYQRAHLCNLIVFVAALGYNNYGYEQSSDNPDLQYYKKVCAFVTGAGRWWYLKNVYFFNAILSYLFGQPLIKT